jgi:hypothetical protein
MPGFGHLHDVSRNGSVLIARENVKLGIMGLPPGAAKEVDCSWFDWTLLRDISLDGRWILFDETGEGGGEEGAVYLRATDGSPAIRLGSGYGMGLSPDGKQVLSKPMMVGDILVLPTGVGEPRTVPVGGLTIHWGAWHPDGRRMLIAGNRKGEAVRMYVLDPDGGSMRAVTPPGVPTLDCLTSPDGQWVVAPGVDAVCALYPLEDGEPRSIPGIERWDRPCHWSRDLRHLYVYKRGQLPARIERLDLETGERAPWRELMPADPAGVMAVGPVRITPDLNSYFYSYVRVLSDLYMVEGLA